MSSPNPLADRRSLQSVDQDFPVTLVLGAGAWGTALAIHLARRAPVGRIRLWAREAERIEALVVTDARGTLALRPEDDGDGGLR